MSSSSLPILAAVASGDIEYIQTLLLQEAEVNVADEDGNTLLHVAARHTANNTDMIEALANAGININATNVDGWTPVYISACGRVDDHATLKALAKLGADVNIPSRIGWSPLLMATQRGHLQSVRTLLQCGADLNLANDGEMIPLLLAVCLRHGEVTHLIVNEGADITSFMAKRLPETAVHEELNQFCRNTNTRTEDRVDMYSLFSIAKLMSSALPDSHDTHDKEQFEAAIAGVFQTSISDDTIEHIKQTGYTLKRVLFRFAWRIHSYSPLVKRSSGGGSQVTCHPRQYVQLVCLFLNESMLTEVFALRLTSKSSHYRQRFPVTCLTHYQELEARMIESFIAYEPSHLVPSSLFQRLIGIHRMDNVSKHMVEINEVLET